MIYFTGCSFTWGAGLQYDYLRNKEGWSVDKINKHIPPMFKLEDIGYDADEYRKKYHFPNLVAEEMDKTYKVLNLHNGGSNYSILEDCKTLPFHETELVVVQFTDWVREHLELRAINPEELSEEKINSIIFKQIEEINNVIKKRTQNKKWIGISWRKDLALVLKEHFPENHVPIFYDRKEYDSFEEVLPGDTFNNYNFSSTENLRICDVIKGVKDTHLSSKGHQMIADSITFYLNFKEIKNGRN
mgnify:FL=1